MRNPFTPNFGQVPIHMAGREALIEEVSYGFENAPGDPNLSTILIGARGTGKTALLSYLASRAESMGWIAVNVSCIEGMLEDVEQQALRKAAHLIDTDAQARLKGLGIAQIASLEWENAPREQLNWRSRMTNILERLNGQDVGLLITVDEVDPELDEMIQLASVYQHFVREERKVSLIMAGLPFKVSGLLGDTSVSFLRRACQHRIGRVSDSDVRDAFRQTVAMGKSIGDAELDEAVRAIEGFPFMMQLVGYRCWQAAGQDDVIEMPHVKEGIVRAAEDMKNRVLLPTLDELSMTDLDFLEVIVERGGAAAADVAKELGRGSGYVSTYKRRLLEQGVIEQRGRSMLVPALPMLDQYLGEYLESCS